MLASNSLASAAAFPAKPIDLWAQPFGGRLSEHRDSLCLLEAWVAPPWIKPHNDSLALEIKKCIYTLLSPETAFNQFRARGGRSSTDKGSPGSYTCRLDLTHGFKSGRVHWQDKTIQRWWVCAHVEVIRIALLFISFIQYSSLVGIQLQYIVQSN